MVPTFFLGLYLRRCYFLAMRRIATAALGLVMAIAPSISFAATTPVAGSKCGQVNSYYGSGSKKMVCSLVKKKLIWVKVLVPKTTIPTQSPPQNSTPSPSPSNTYPQNNQSSGNNQNNQNNANTQNNQGANQYAGLPLLSTFKTNLSSVFPVDFSNAIFTIPYLGQKSKAPHGGLHVHWSNTDGHWTNTGGTSNVTAYPVVRAFADGIIELVTNQYTMATTNGNGHQRYGVVLAFAVTDKGVPVFADYSLEPLIMEPSPHFYEAFIKVKLGQHVKKGDILAYMYVPPESTGGTHVHFNFMAGIEHICPSIFTPEVVSAFTAKYLDKSWLSSGVELPAVIGYGLAATENPFVSEAVDYL